jgi:dsRNA-specific ribonuclease
MDREDQKDLINAVAARFTNYFHKEDRNTKRQFVVQAVWERIVLGQGCGRNKKQAETAAAIEAMQLKRWEKKREKESA